MRPGAKSRVWPAVLGVLLAGVGRATPASGQRNEAPLAEVEARSRADSNDPVVLLELAQAYLRARRRDEARRALETAIQIDRQFAPGYTLLGRLLAVRSGPPIAAVVHPSEGRMRLVVLHADSTTDSTARLFRRAFLLDPMQKIYPIHPDAFPVVWRGTLSHALSYYRRDRFELSAAAFDSVIVQSDRRRRDPPPVALWYHALSAMQLHQVDLAIRDMERLLDRALRDSSFAADVQSRSARYVLAHLHQEASRSPVLLRAGHRVCPPPAIAVAREAWERCLALAPRRYNDMIADARSRLAKLP